MLATLAFVEGGPLAWLNISAALNPFEISALVNTPSFLQSVCVSLHLNSK